MVEKIMRVHIPDGAGLSNSQTTPGHQSPLARDAEGQLVGQAKLSELDESELNPPPVYIFADQMAVEERDEATELIAGLALLGVLVAIEKAAPHVKQWARESAIPAMKASRERLAKAVRRGRRVKDGAQLAVTVEVAGDPAPSAAVVAATPQVTMSSAEWQERFRLMLLAGAFQEEQWRLLSSAQVEDGDDVREVQGAMANLSPEQIADGMRLALEGNSGILDAEVAAQVSKTFAGVSVRDGERALPGSERPA